MVATALVAKDNKISTAFRYLFFLIVVFLLQVTVFDQVSFFGIKPDIFPIVFISYALLKGQQAGVLAGFFSGLLLDLSVNTPYGFSALAAVVVGFMLPALISQNTKLTRLKLALFEALGSLYFEFLFAIFLLVSQQKGVTFGKTVSVCIISVVAVFVLTLIFSRLLEWFVLGRSSKLQPQSRRFR